MKRVGINILLLNLMLSTAVMFAQATSLKDQEQGKQFFNLVQQQLPLVTDPIVNDYIQALGYRLVAYSDAPTHIFHFFIIQKNIINAFAGPDGYVGIFAGLIDTTQTESELASVIAHEIGHVTQHHLQRGEDKTKNLTLPMLAAMVGAIATGNGAIAFGSISSITAGSIQYQINTTRTFEEEADSMGIQTLASAGFNPQAMATFFEKLQQQSRYDQTPPPLLLDHPVTTERIALAEQRARTFTLKKSYPSSTTYYLAKARLQYFLAQDAKNFLTQAAADAKKHPQAIYQKYLLALAQVKNHDYATAVQLLTDLSHADPNELIYPYTLAQVAFLQKKYSIARKYIQQAYAMDNNNYPTVIFYGTILLRAQQADDAVKLLEQYQVTFATSPNFWILLSQAYAATHNLIYAYLARAHAFLAQEDIENALIQLKIAQQQLPQTAYTRRLIQAERQRLQKILKVNALSSQ